MKQDFFINNKDGWARIRSCGIIIEDGCVLMVTNDNVDYYYSLGGAIHIGETFEEACLREIFEETGIHYEIGRLAFIHENFFYRNAICHEIAFYYLMKPKGSQILNSNSIGLDGFQETLKWIPIDEYQNHKSYPTFFAEELPKLNESFIPKHIITKE